MLHMSRSRWSHLSVFSTALAVTVALAGGFGAVFTLSMTAHAQTKSLPQPSARVAAGNTAWILAAASGVVEADLWDVDMPEAQEAGDDGALLLADEGLLDDDDGMDDAGTLLAESSGESGAWTDGDEDAPLYELAALTVQGLVATDYTPAAPPAVGGPMGLTMKETAQSVSVVTEQRIKDQGLTTATDVMRWVPGVNVGSGVGQESFSANARGFSINNVMIDGQSIGGTGTISNDLSLYESVEVLRGAAGLFAGSGTDGSPAGAVSLTRKKPTRKPQLTMSASAGSWDNYKASVDVGGPLVESGRLRARGIVSWIDRKFDYDFAFRKSHTAGLSLDVDITPDTLLSIGGDMEERKYLSGQRRHAFWNWDWTVTEVRGDDRSNLIPWGGAKRNQRSAFVKLDHVFANDWNLKLNYTRMRYTLKTDYTSIGTTFDGDTQQAVHYLSSSWGDSKNWDEAFGADFTGDFELFGQEHKFVLGYNYQSNWSRSVAVPGWRERRDNGTFYAYDWENEAGRVFVDFDDLDYFQYLGRPPHLFDMGRIRIEKPRRQSGVYANLRLKLMDPLVLTGGVRISRYQRDGRIDTWLDPSAAGYLTSVYKETNVVTPFAALSYDFNEQHTAHLSYAEIFRVQNQYGLDGEFVDPLTGENLELGLKSDWNDGRLTTSLSVYKLDRIGGTWRAVDSPCPIVMDKHGIEAACYVADDHQRTIGVDFEMTGQLAKNWDISVGASWMKTKYIRWTNNGGATSSNQGGGFANNNPKKQLKIWSMYRLPGAASKWRVGVGMQMQDRTWENQSARNFEGLTSKTNTQRPAYRIVRPGYTLWNAMVAFEVSKTWQAQLNVENLTNKRFHHGFNRNYIYLNEPRNFNFTLTGRFQ